MNNGNTQPKGNKSVHDNFTMIECICRKYADHSFTSRPDLDHTSMWILDKNQKLREE